MADTLLSHCPAEHAGDILGVTSGKQWSGGEFCCIAAEEKIENPSDWFVSQVLRENAQLFTQAVDEVLSLLSGWFSEKCGLLVMYAFNVSCCVFRRTGQGETGETFCLYRTGLFFSSVT